MKIDVQIKVSEEFMQEFHQTGKTQTSEAARGWVEIENAIKFPVVIRPYLDKETGKMMTFVSYPQRKTDSGYETVFYPTDKEVKKEIETSIYKEFMRVATKDIAPDVSIEDVRVTLLDKPQTGKIALKGIASVKIFGCVINDILIKESDKGLFIQMPQYKTSKGQYKDTVYGTSLGMQKKIQWSVLESYEVKLRESMQQKQKPEGLEVSKNEEKQMQQYSKPKPMAAPKL